MSHSAPSQTGGPWEPDNTGYAGVAGGSSSRVPRTSHRLLSPTQPTTSCPQANDHRHWEELERRRLHGGRPHSGKTSRAKAIESAIKMGSLGDVIEAVDNYRQKGRNIGHLAFGRDLSTPLHEASTGGFLDICQWLLDNTDVNINAQDSRGMTPIYRAVASCHVAIVKLLLDKHADCNTETASGDYPFLLAAEIGNVEILELFLEADGTNIHVIDGYGSNALARACLGPNFDAVHRIYMVDRELSQNLDQAGLSAYDVAAYGCQIDACRLLGKDQQGDVGIRKTLLQTSTEPPVGNSTSKPICVAGRQIEDETDPYHNWYCLVPWTTLAESESTQGAQMSYRLLIMDMGDVAINEARLLAGDNDGWRYEGQLDGPSRLCRERSALDLDRYQRALTFLNTLSPNVERDDLIAAYSLRCDHIKLWLARCDQSSQSSQQVMQIDARNAPPDPHPAFYSYGGPSTSSRLIEDRVDLAPRQSSLRLRASSTSLRSTTQPLPIPRPYWQPDEEAADCAKCDRQFSFFIRRHHCRRCGLVVCDRCSNNRVLMEESEIIHDPSYSSAGFPYADAGFTASSGLQRVCDDCYFSLRGPQMTQWPLTNSTSVPTALSDLMASITLPSVPDMSNSGELGECPVCGAALLRMTTLAAREEHLQQCLDGGVAAKGNQIRGRYLVYRIPERSAIIGEECAICFIEFQEGEKAARLSCLCSYHQVCIEAWFATGHSCPVHVR